MIGHMRHGSPPRLMALQSILSPNRRESSPTPSAGVRMIEKREFEPRIAELRRRLTRLEAEASEQQAAEEQARSLQRVIGKLDLFAAMVRDRLASADWSTKREIICLLVKRIEVAKDVVRVVFRVDPGSSAPSEARQSLPHCLAGRHPASDVERRHPVPLRPGTQPRRGLNEKERAIT